MQFVNLGCTGLKVSRICLGMMTYGTPKWRDWVLDEEASRPFIQRAVELGINFFDTADVYSLGVSECARRTPLRNAVASLLRTEGWTSLPNGFRYCRRLVQIPLRLMGLLQLENTLHASNILETSYRIR